MADGDCQMAVDGGQIDYLTDGEQQTADCRWRVKLEMFFIRRIKTVDRFTCTMYDSYDMSD